MEVSRGWLGQCNDGVWSSQTVHDGVFLVMVTVHDGVSYPIDQSVQLWQQM